MMLVVPFSPMTLSKISTLRFAITMTPVPVGTLATIFPFGAKFGVMLLTMILPNIRTLCPPICGRLGRSNTKTPPVLRVAILS